MLFNICLVVLCGNELSSTIPSNGAITYATDTSSPFDSATTATYSCQEDQGYQLVAQFSVRTCAQFRDTSTGFWSPSSISIPPRCDCKFFFVYLVDPFYTITSRKNIGNKKMK